LSGANVMAGGIAKKAFLQSAPWALSRLAMLALSSRLGLLETERPAHRLGFCFRLVTAGAVLGAFAVSGRDGAMTDSPSISVTFWNSCP
jgi:hypothetical protein